MRLPRGIFFRESEPFTPLATSGRTTAGQPYRFKGGQARRSPLLLSSPGTTAVKSSAPHPAEPELPSARAKLRALRSAARSAAASGGWSSAPCGAELFLCHADGDKSADHGGSALPVPLRPCATKEKPSPTSLAGEGLVVKPQIRGLVGLMIPGETSILCRLEAREVFRWAARG